jgi:hypothetical protein
MGSTRRPRGTSTMIIETIVSTRDESGNPNFAPMGIALGEEYVTVRPYRQTQTCRNLLSGGCGVANISDDVLAYVQCGLYDAILPFSPARIVQGFIYQDTCAWWELEVVSKIESGDRLDVQCRVVYRGHQKEFMGFCRAKNAVIEGAILATRLGLLDRKLLMDKLVSYREIVEKTGSEKEAEAFRLIWEYVQKGSRHD